MKLSVIIPVYNEASTVLEVIRRVQDVPLEKDIIVVDDGSTDGTREMLKQSYPASLYSSSLKGDEGEGDIKIILKEKNGGKGSAVREGLKHIAGDIVIIQDADLELNPVEYPSLLAPILQGETKVVFGSRFRKKVPGVNKWLLTANRIFTMLMNVLYRTNITDVMTCYKVIHREVIGKLVLKSNCFDIEPELAGKICKLGYSIHEIPVAYKPRRFSSGKKISFMDSFSVIGALIRYRFFD